MRRYSCWRISIACITDEKRSGHGSRGSMVPQGTMDSVGTMVTTLVPPTRSLVMFSERPGGTRAAAKRTRGLGRSPNETG